MFHVSYTLNSHPTRPGCEAATSMLMFSSFHRLYCTRSEPPASVAVVIVIPLCVEMTSDPQPVQHFNGRQWKLEQ